jgi:hypothetical protein
MTNGLPQKIDFLISVSGHLQGHENMEIIAKIAGMYNLTTTNAIKIFFLSFF